MKSYTERHVRRSELFQLILLQHLYARPESSRLIFQGGTAIRWCHNSGRFSEDLDFVTHLERPYLKGRDIYDIWHLRERLGVSVVRDMVERKFSCYAAPFTLRRSPDWFEAADSGLKEAIENDLGRFLPPEVMAACRNDGYRPFLNALKGLFRELRESGAEIPS